MRAALLIALALAAAAFAALWLTGAFDTLAAFAAGQQREAQNALARGLRALKTGEAGALAAVLGIAFAYGVFHAAGPGHGKVLIGGFGLARPVGALRLSLLALLSSLAQATTAVLLVFTGVLVLDWTRERMVDVAEGVMAPVSYAAIMAIGLWLAWRGARHLAPARAPDPDHHAHDDHSHDAHCGHSHGPTPAEIAAVTGWRDAALLIGGIAMRPCSGALFLLVITVSMGVPAAGILGTYAMGLGTAAITVAVALGSVWFRQGLARALDGSAARLALATLELAAGLVVAAAALELLRRAL